ncbi:hypothetical protein JNW90_30855 [Micromonospora sp. STR1s_5]|nr:hypothetical protein [Micromonospora sp. STR1s_5]
MLIELWLDQPVWLILGVLAAFFGASALLIFWITQGRLSRSFVGTFSGVVAPFFGAVGILFALLDGLSRERCVGAEPAGLPLDADGA